MFIIGGVLLPVHVADPTDFDPEQLYDYGRRVNKISATVFHQGDLAELASWVRHYLLIIKKEVIKPFTSARHQAVLVGLSVPNMRAHSYIEYF